MIAVTTASQSWIAEGLISREEEPSSLEDYPPLLGVFVVLSPTTVGAA